MTPLTAAALPAGTTHRAGLTAAALTVLLTLLTFGLALTAVPISGANCPGDCVTYPYLDTLAQFPHDYRWMMPAMLLTLVTMGLMATLHAAAAPQHALFSLLALILVCASSVILLSIYYVQLNVVPMSLRSGETAGIPLLTQYNPHGLFIALEELGYLLLAGAFPFAAASIAATDRLTTAIRWVFAAGFTAVLLALVLLLAGYGLDRLDRLETALITVDWLVLLVNGVLLALYFQRRSAADTAETIRPFAAY